MPGGSPPGASPAQPRAAGLAPCSGDRSAPDSVAARAVARRASGAARAAGRAAAAAAAAVVGEGGHLAVHSLGAAAGAVDLLARRANDLLELVCAAGAAVLVDRHGSPRVPGRSLSDNALLERISLLKTLSGDIFFLLLFLDKQKK